MCPNKIKSDRSNGIDILKFCCALLIVFIHVEFKYRLLVLPITRCAVPIFFIISGFYIYNDDEDVMTIKIKQSILKVSRILFFSTVLYSIIFFAHNNKFSITNKDLFNIFCLNDNPFGGHLWYLSAYLYVLVIFLWIFKTKLLKLLMYLLPVFFLITLCAGNYSQLLFGRQFNYMYYRNFLIVGIPYFLLGYCISKNKLNYLFKHRCLLGIGILFGVLVSETEYVLLQNLKFIATQDFFFGSVILSITLFLYFVSFKSNNPIFTIIAGYGKKYSLYLYIFHPLIYSFWLFLIKEGYISNYLNEYVAPFVVILLTLSFSIVFDHMISLKKAMNLNVIM